jgi:hypothetical protein
MRASLLVACLLALVASPAAADRVRHRDADDGLRMHRHHSFFSRFSQVSPFSPFFRLRHGGPFSPFATTFPIGFDDGFGFGGFDAGAGFGGAPGIVMLNAPPVAAAAPARPMIDDRPSVERTAQGVTIIRGPGSHHTMH